MVVCPAFLMTSSISSMLPVLRTTLRTCPLAEEEDEEDMTSFTLTPPQLPRASHSSPTYWHLPHSHTSLQPLLSLSLFLSPSLYISLSNSASHFNVYSQSHTRTHNIIYCGHTLIYTFIMIPLSLPRMLYSTQRDSAPPNSNLYIPHSTFHVYNIGVHWGLH